MNILSWIKWIILIPLAFIGGINAFRGLIAVGEKDVKKYDIDVGKGWRFYVYMLITTAGYIAFFYLLADRYF